MMHRPSDASLAEVELRLVRSRRTAQNSLRRARETFLFKATKPTSLALAVGLGGLFGFFTTPRARESAAAKPQRAERGASFRPLMVSLVGVAIRSLPFMLWRLRLARSKRIESADAAPGEDVPESPI